MKAIRSFPKSMHPQRSGFTLIEILVVVSIISLLIAIMLPALSKARQQAKNTVCLTNLRTLGQAVIMYADATKDRMPNGNQPGTFTELATDIYAQPPYIPVLVNLNTRYVRNPASFHCPLDTDPVPSAIVSSDYLSSAQPYYPNTARISYDFYSVWWFSDHGPKLTRIKFAPLAWDLLGGNDGYRVGPDKKTHLVPLQREPRIWMQNHGTKGGNVVFGDGHATWEPQPRWDRENMPNPGDRYYSKG